MLVVSNLRFDTLWFSQSCFQVSSCDFVSVLEVHCHRKNIPVTYFAHNICKICNWRTYYVLICFRYKNIVKNMCKNVSEGVEFWWGGLPLWSYFDQGCRPLDVLLLHVSFWNRRKGIDQIWIRHDLVFVIIFKQKRNDFSLTKFL